MVRGLQRQLGALFRPEAEKRGDPHRKARELAKPLAKRLGVEVERLAGSGFNVWPPRALQAGADPFEGDHYAADWSEVLKMVQAYEKASTPAESGD